MILNYENPLISINDFDLNTFKLLNCGFFELE